MRETKAYKKYPQIMDQIWALIVKEVYSEEDPYRKIGFRDHNGTTTFYSQNVIKQDAENIDAFMQTIGLSPINTRLIKHSEILYEIRIGSISPCTPYNGHYTYTTK